MQIETYDARGGNEWAILAELRPRLAKLAPAGDQLSESARELTVRVFGAPLTPQQVVQQICDQVRQEGFPAVQRLTRELDRADIAEGELRVEMEEMAEAHSQASPVFLDAIRRIRDHVVEFQSAILHSNVLVQRQPGVVLEHRYAPLARVGVCVPGGSAAYPSSLLMAAIPAQVAGVSEIAVVAPPTPYGSYNASLLAACFEIGISEVYRIGGAQAVAALAFGIPGLRRVDKIVGPGSLYVALAKKHVYGHVDIDSIAGPSEVMVIADDSCDPRWVALDLIAQAEHYPGSAILVTWSEKLLDRVRQELESCCQSLERGSLAAQCLEEFGALLLVDDWHVAAELANELAPEHLHLQSEHEDSLAAAITTAGAIFLGRHTPVAVGDYIAGPSHVLPTGGTARWASGLSSNDFLRSHAVIRYDAASLAADGPALMEIAELEGLTAHRDSVAVRLQSP